MRVNGERLPYVEVSADFSRSPAGYSYETKSKPRGGSKVRGKRLDSEEITVPIVISRRGNEDKAWDDIIKELTDVLYVDGPVEVSFPYRDNDLYYLGEVMALEISEEHEYIAKGEIDLFCEDQVLFGEQHTLSVGTDEEYYDIKGQMNVPWTMEVVFDESSSEFKFNGPDEQILALNYGFEDEDLLRIDFLERRVRVNGSEIPNSVDIRSEWFRIPNGDVQLSASHKAEITYRERYY